jgi:hypothetical protein
MDKIPKIEDYLNEYTMEMKQGYPRFAVQKMLKFQMDISNLQPVMWMFALNPEDVSSENFLTFLEALTVEQSAVVGF